MADGSDPIEQAKDKAMVRSWLFELLALLERKEVDGAVRVDIGSDVMIKVKVR